MAEPERLFFASPARKQRSSAPPVGRLQADRTAEAFQPTSDTSPTPRRKTAQERLAQLVPNAKHITNTNTGHEIHKEQPQLVIDSIREMVEAVRGGSSHMAR